MIESKHSMSTRSGGFRCKVKGEDGFTLCGNCVSCVFTDKLVDCTRWLSRAGGSAKRTFLMGLLAHCTGVPVREGIRDVLQVTLGKDFTYARSKRPSLADDVITYSSNRALDGKLLRADALDTLRWFSRSHDWMKSHYLCSVMSLCDTGLLHMLANLNDVLLAREQRACLPRHVPAGARGAWARQWGPRDDQGSDGEDPALAVLPRSSASLSGVARHRDFLRSLPVHLAKRILGLLDRLTVRACRNVSQNWRYLADDLVLDQNAQKVVRHQVLIMQSYQDKKVLSDVYANILHVLVPADAGEDADVPSGSQPFGGAYSGVRTRAVQMEERNVYCGLYSIATLLEKDDPHRVVHYAGGALVAVGSKDRAVRLLSAASKKEAAPGALKGHAGSVRAVLLCEARGLVVSAGYDLSIRCWSLKTSVCVAVLNGHTGTVNCMDAHMDHLVSGARDCRVKVWDLREGKCLEALRWRHPGSVQCVRLSWPLVYSSCAQGLIKTWDIERASLLRVLEGHTSSVKCLFSDRWHLLSGDAEGRVMAWSTHRAAARCLMTFTHPMAVVSVALAFLRVVTGCADGLLRVFSFLTGDCLRALKAGSPVLSVHLHGNNVLVNTTSSLQLFQFVRVDWEYSGPSSPSAEAPAPTPAAPPPGRIPHEFVRAERMALVGSPCRRIYGPAGERAERAELTHHARCVSAGRMRRAREAQLESLRPCSWSDLRSHRRSRAYLDLQPEFRTPPPSALSPGRPAARRGPPESAWTPRRSSKAKASGETAMTALAAVDASARSAARRARRRGPHHRPTTDRILLRVNAVQQARGGGGGGGEAAINMERNAGLRDAWGSPPPPPPPPPPCRLTSPGPPQGRQTPLPPAPGPQNRFTGGRTPLVWGVCSSPDREGGANAPVPRAHSDRGTRRHGASLLKDRNQAEDHPCGRERPHTGTAAAVAVARGTPVPTPHTRSEPRPQGRASSGATGKGPERRVNFQATDAPAERRLALEPLRQRGGFRQLTDDQLRRYISLTRSLGGVVGDPPAGKEATSKNISHTADLHRSSENKAWTAEGQEATKRSFTHRGRWKH